MSAGGQGQSTEAGATPVPRGAKIPADPAREQGIRELTCFVDRARVGPRGFDHSIARHRLASQVARDLARAFDKPIEMPRAPAETGTVRSRWKRPRPRHRGQPRAR